MLRLFSPQHKFGLWRRLWLELARCRANWVESMPPGNERISAEALRQMEAAVDQIDFPRAAEWEKKLRHDVMAHVHTFEEAAQPPKASCISAPPANMWWTTPT